MGKHKERVIKVLSADENDYFFSYCGNCGLFLTNEITNKSCPPWESTDKEDTKAKRVGGEVESLRAIRQRVWIAREETIKQSLSSKMIVKNELWDAINAIDELIQKHETKNG